MSLWEPTLLSLARAGVVALATLGLLLVAGTQVRTVSRRWKGVFFWLSMMALLAPGFASGFYRYETAMKLGAAQREWYYGGLVWLRYAWLAVLVVWVVPPAYSREALHCLRLGKAGTLRQRLHWYGLSWGRGLWLGVGLVFLLAFQEFELATTWNLRSWTVALFDAQAGGWPLVDSLCLGLGPLTVQGVLLGVLAWGWRRYPPAPEGEATDGHRLKFILLTVLLGVWAQGFPILQISLMLPHEWSARGWEVFELVPWREMANGAGLAAAATVFAWTSAGWMVARGGWRWVLAVPGLFGPMLCGLLVIAGLRLPGLAFLRDTVFAPVLGLCLLLLPLALLLRVGIERTRDEAALHSAWLAGAARVRWTLDGWPRAFALLLLFGFGYGDFTINSLLAPPQFTSASVRLLNLLHYGRSSALGVMFALAFAVPLLAALLTVLAVRFYARRRVR